MVRKKKYSDKDKIAVNNRHIDIFNKSLDGIEIMLNGILSDLSQFDGSFLDLPKSLISALDFIISSLSKIQKGQRLALNLDDENISSENVEPDITVIEWVDIKKI